MTAFWNPVCKPDYANMLNSMYGEHKTLMVSTATCGFCHKAKALLEHYNIKYNEVKLDEIQGIDQVEVANCIYGDKRRFVPQIYMNDKHVGGFSELYSMHQKGEITKNE